MAKETYRRVVAVDEVVMERRIERRTPRSETASSLERIIQNRVDAGWTYRGLAGVVVQDEGTAVVQYLVFVRKEPRDG